MWHRNRSMHKHACMASHMSRRTCTVRTVWCQKGDIGLSPRRSFIFSYHLSGVQIQMSLLIFDIFLYICISQSLKVCFHMFHISLPSSSGGSEASNMQTAELHDSGNSDEWRSHAPAGTRQPSLLMMISDQWPLLILEWSISPLIGPCDQRKQQTDNPPRQL